MNPGPLIPIKRGRKGTYLDEWSTLTPEALEELASQNTGGNVGLRLDQYASIDPDSPAAKMLCETWERQEKLPPTWAWTTASGAIRRVYLRPHDLKEPMTVAAIDLQLRTGSGMYDVIPPSYVKDPKKGIDGFYRWLPGQSPEDIEPAPLPRDILDYFKRHSQPKESPPPRDVDPDKPTLDVQAYLEHYGIEVIKVKPYRDGTLYCLSECIFDSNHQPNEAAIFQAGDGLLSYQCFHNSCTGKLWAEAKERISGQDKLGSFLLGDPAVLNQVSTSNKKLTSALVSTRGEDPLIKALTECNLDQVHKNYLLEIIEKTKPKKNIAAEVREWVLTTKGNFLTTNVHNELCLTTSDYKKAANIALMRLKDEGVIVECGNKRGCYRTIEHEAPEIDWQNARTDRVYSLKWPFELEKLVNIYPKNIVVVAGAPNAGKTAFMLNLVRLNLDDTKIHFLSSEMGPEELNLRITKFEDYRPKFWKRFRPRERASNFADAIKPNAVNIIDYFEISDNFYQIGAEMRAIHDKLKDGIAVIAMQKKKGAELGRGAEFSLEKPRLYITMEPGVLKIVKGKNWAKPGFNPNNLELKFKLINGCEFLEYE